MKKDNTLVFFLEQLCNIIEIGGGIAIAASGVYNYLRTWGVIE